MRLKNIEIMKRIEKRAYKQALKDLKNEFKTLIPMGYGFTCFISLQ